MYFILFLLIFHLAPKTGQNSSKYHWKKRWILLQDNFLLCYKCDEEMMNPILVFRLQNHKLIPIAEREIGKKFTFLLSAGHKTYYFAAANLQIFMKWINVLAEVKPWCQSEEDILFREFEVGDGGVVKKSESVEKLLSDTTSPSRKRTFTLSLMPSNSRLPQNFNSRPRHLAKRSSSSLTHRTFKSKSDNIM